MAVTTDDILREIDAQDPKIKAAFFEYVRRVISSMRVAALEAAIAEGRIDTIPALFRIGSATLSPLVEAVREALKAGGEFLSQTARNPKLGAVIQFDMRDTTVERWIQQHSAELVTDITADQQAAIRFAVQSGVEAGRNPRSIALDIVGRLDKATGNRVGGIVGLTQQQARYVVNARSELESLSADYFSRAARDKRFDSIVRKAIASGKPLTQAQIDKILARYADRLLQYRGEVIGRTEALGAFNAGRDIAMQQAIADGTVRAENVTSIWETAHDSRVRETHHEMQGQSVPFGGVFTSPSGARLRYPGDTSLGAPASEVIQCRCVTRHSINWIDETLGRG
jgi:hypothetical protein